MKPLKFFKVYGLVDPKKEVERMEIIPLPAPQYPEVFAAIRKVLDSVEKVLRCSAVRKDL